MSTEGTSGPALAVSLRVAASRAYVPCQGARPEVAASRGGSSVAGLPVYLTVEIEPPASCEVRAALNLALVIDRSGSMFGSERLNSLLRACRIFIDELDGQDKCAVVAFADRAQLLEQGRIAERQPQLLAGLDKIIDIDPFEIGGGSNLSQGIAVGYQAVQAEFAATQINRVILITDGRTGVEHCLTLAAEMSAAGIAITTIGLGDDFDENLLTAIAERSGGNYYYTGNSNDIPKIFACELERLRAITIKAALLKIRLLDGVKLIDAFRFSPEVFSLPLDADCLIDGGYAIGVGDLSANCPAGLLFGLLVPPDSVTTARLAEIELLASVTTTREKIAETAFEIGYSHEPALIGRINSAVMASVDRVCVVKLKEQAETALVTGNYKQAIRLLNSIRALTERLGYLQLSQLFDQLLEQVGTQGRMESASAKRASLLVRSLGSSLADKLPSLKTSSEPPLEP